jgi:hypothetical protein
MNSTQQHARPLARKWVPRAARADDFDQRPRPEWMLTPWKDSEPLQLIAWEQVET